MGALFWRFTRLFSWALFWGIGLAILIPLVLLAFDALTARQGISPNIPGSIIEVHALGVNPKNGRLYAATARGLYIVLAVDKAERVTDSYQDNRGFAVAGPDRFFSSGKPDIRDLVSRFEPPMLGLQRSENGGRTWITVSLRGRATFSSLAVRHGLIYGFEQGEQAFMVSRDEGRSWETLSQPPPLLDFAVSPSDPDTIVATTAGPPLLSRDGGVTWQPLAGVVLKEVEWQVEGRVWAVDADGGVYTSSDGGATWQQAQSVLPGEPKGFLVSDGAFYAAVSGNLIYRSTDAGLSWQLFYRAQAPAAD